MVSFILIIHRYIDLRIDNHLHLVAINLQNRLLSFTILSLVFWCVPAHSLSVRLDLSDAVRSSIIVALVEIESGELVTTESGKRCGARYVARVIRGIKNATPGERIELGHFTRHEIGGQYFVFLEKVSDFRRRNADTPAPAMSSPSLYDKECVAALPQLTEIAEGMGAIALKSGEFVGYRPAVTLESPPYVIPSTLAGTGYHKGRFFDGQFFGLIQIEGQTFVDFLLSIR